MTNKAIHAGRLALKAHRTPFHSPSTPHSGTLSRKELQKIVEEMLG